MYGNNDRQVVKDLGAINGDTSIWPSGIKIWCANVSTAVAPVAAMPTTAAHFSLFNGNPQGSGISAIILAVGSITTTSAAAAIETGLAACVTTVLITTQTGTAASTIRPLTGNALYGGACTVLSAVTIVDNGLWLPVTESKVNANTANIMSNIHSDVNGRYVIMPGQTFNLATLCNAAGSAVCKPYIIWAETTFRT
jgi:hypothetical protein